MLCNTLEIKLAARRELMTIIFFAFLQTGVDFANAYTPPPPCQPTSTVVGIGIDSDGLSWFWVWQWSQGSARFNLRAFVLQGYKIPAHHQPRLEHSGSTRIRLKENYYLLTPYSYHELDQPMMVAEPITRPPLREMRAKNMSWTLERSSFFSFGRSRMSIFWVRQKAFPFKWRQTTQTQKKFFNDFIFWTREKMFFLGETQSCLVSSCFADGTRSETG